MEADDPSGHMKIVLKLVPGRDDLVISLLQDAKPKFRADRVRIMLHMHAMGQTGALTKDPASRAGTTAADVPQQAPKKVLDEAKEPAGLVGATAAGSGAMPDVGEEDVFSQLEGISMQVNFAGVSGGRS